jgi:hypothetical protein
MIRRVILFAFLVSVSLPSSLQAQSVAGGLSVGVLRYAQRIGDAAVQTEHHVWTVEFVRGGESWKIARITAQ